MIQAFVGLVGGGKSYNSVRRMMSYMARGGRVASNIELTGWDDKNQRFIESSPVLGFLRGLGWEYQIGQYTYIPFDDMVSNPHWFKRIPAGQDRDHRTLCVVDEATDLFDSLDGGKLKSDLAYRELFRFLRLSRHAHIDVLFICQDLQSINSRLKGLVAGIWRSTDMKGFKLKGIPVPFPFDTFLLQLFDRTGRNLIQREWVPKDKAVYTLYQSEVFGGALGVKWADSAIKDGTIKVGDKMTKCEKVFFGVPLALSLGLSIYGLFRSPTPSVVTERVIYTNTVERVQGPKKAPSRERNPETPAAPAVSNVYHYGSYRLRYTPYKRWVEFDGKVLTEGFPSSFGSVVRCSEEFTLCRRDDGSFAYLLPSLQSDSGTEQMEKPVVHTKSTLPLL